MNLANVVFPLYKLRSYLSIDTNPLGLIKVTTIKGVYILDDTSIRGTFGERRVLLSAEYPSEKIYKLKEKVSYLRQLVKYRSGTTFMDYNGHLIKYRKSSKLFKINSHKINRKEPYGNWTIIYLDGIEIPFIVGETLTPNAKFASIMRTTSGPFLYDITSIQHDTYRRKI